nr:MAG TPA: hypothetical protein [Caudoviricetes sp.]
MLCKCVIISFCVIIYCRCMAFYYPYLLYL